MTTRPKRFMACLLAITLATTPIASQPADLNSEMQAMFNDLGALGNVTSPGAFRGQAMNLYTGGSLMMRAPGRNYPLINAQLCSSDPLCSEHDPEKDRSLHAASCHACSLVAETSCERGNRYLDRSLLVPTLERIDAAFFGGV
jgi:hypothetical protein